MFVVVSLGADKIKRYLYKNERGLLRWTPDRALALRFADEMIAHRYALKGNASYEPA